MTYSSFLKKTAIALSAVFIIACDKDFNEIGADIIDDDLHNEILKYDARVTAYDRATGAVQANNLPVNSLGIYNNYAFGKTTAHFVTQLELAVQNPVFSEPVIDSVYLYVPYTSTREATLEDGTNTYTLESLYGDAAATFRLSVYENGYFLRTSDPGESLISGQRYYSDERPLVEGNKRGVGLDGVSVPNGNRLNDDALASQNEQFFFSNAEVQRKYMAGATEGSPGTETIAERLAPGIFMYLNKQFFQQKILSAPAGKLLNNNIFKEYFRGLYFKVEQDGEGAALTQINFSAGKVTVVYHDHKKNVDGTFDTSAPKERKVLSLNLTGNTVNFFENSYNQEYLSALNTDDENGDNLLYVKGGEGSVAFIDINMEDLLPLKEQNMGQRVLINEANLSFYIDKSKMINSYEPLRVYLYDVTNKRPILDYATDVSTNGTNSKYDKSIHGGLIESAGDGRGRYKIRLTHHIDNIINRDSTNVKLGLVVTENINLIGNAALRTPVISGGSSVKEIPSASVMNPLGTILYGSNPELPEDKRLKLEIFYTKPN